MGSGTAPHAGHEGHQRLSDLVARADQLWPEVPANVQAMQEWLAEAEKLVQNLPQHRQTLELLRSAALPYDEAIQQHDRDTHPSAARLRALEREWERIDRQMASEEGLAVDGQPGAQGPEPRKDPSEGEVYGREKDLVELEFLNMPVGASPSAT